MINDYKRVIEIILIKNKNIDGLKAVSKIKNTLISHGSDLVNKALEYFDSDKTTRYKLDYFPECDSEPIKYFHVHILDDKEKLNESNYEHKLNLVKRMIFNTSPESEYLADCDGFDVLTKVAIKLLDELAYNKDKYRDIYNKFMTVNKNSVLRIYVTVDDDIPDLTRENELNDLFINAVYSGIVSNSVNTYLEPNYKYAQVVICCVADDDPFKSDEEESQIKQTSKESHDIRFGDGEVIKNEDGSIRSVYFNNKSRTLQ